MNHPNWCACNGHNTGDFVRLTDFYCSYFQPMGWELEYSSLAEESARTLYVTGRCSICFGYMQTGMSIPMNCIGDTLFNNIWMSMDTYRPFAFKSADAHGYFGCPNLRGSWYQQQDRLCTEEKETRFAALFRDEDKGMVEGWLEKRRVIPHTQVVRDSAADLFLATVLRAKQYGDWQEAESILDSYLPSDQESYRCDSEKALLSYYEFDFYAEMQFGGSEGIYIDCTLRGKFDDSGRSTLGIGSIKTLKTDLDACKRMGALCGALTYHASHYVNENLHRYTPDTELRAEAAQMEEKSC